MKMKKLIKILLLSIPALALVLVVVLYLVWMPTAKEPGYSLTKEWGSLGKRNGQFDQPTGITIGDGRIFISDSGNDRIQIFDPEGEFIGSFGRSGRGEGELNRPMQLDFHKGNLYVANFVNFSIRLFPESTI